MHFSIKYSLAQGTIEIEGSWDQRMSVQILHLLCDMIDAENPVGFCTTVDRQGWVMGSNIISVSQPFEECDVHVFCFLETYLHGLSWKWRELEKLHTEKEKHTEKNVYLKIISKQIILSHFSIDFKISNTGFWFWSIWVVLAINTLWLNSWCPCVKLQLAPFKIIIHFYWKSDCLMLLRHQIIKVSSRFLPSWLVLCRDFQGSNNSDYHI